MQVRDLMTENPACCTPTTPIEEVAHLMVKHDCGGIPVVENRQGMRLVGMITDRDITCRAVAQGQNPITMTAGDLMSAPVVTVSPDMDMGECCAIMEDSQVRRVPVVDSQGRCCGIVAQADIAHMATGAQVAELVDEISEPSETPSRAGDAKDEG